MPSPDPSKTYLMPALAGWEPRPEGTWYHDVTTLSVSYVTCHEAVARLLPDGFEVGAPPGQEPLVTVSWARNRQVDWLAGGGYNLLGVNVAATFRGQVDTVAGGYCVILWEDRTEPILSGREQTGIPKVFADITDLLPLGGATPDRELRVRASQLGTPIVELTAGSLRELSEPERRALQEAAARGNWMGYKYIPRIGAPGADVAYATLFPSEQLYESASRGQGEVRFFPSSFENNPTQFQAVNLLCALEPLEYRGALLTRGKMRLFSGRARALR